MKWIPNILFGICATLFLIHQYLQKYLSVTMTMADSYLAPLLALPIILHLLNLERKWLVKKRPLSKNEMWGYCILIVIIGEIIFPLISSNFTYDVLDIIFYCTGTVLYLFSVKASRTTNLRQP